MSSPNNYHMIKISTEAKLQSYLFSRREEHGILFPSSISQSEEILSELHKLLSKIERSNPVYTRINIWSEFETGYAGAGSVRSYEPTINGIKYSPRSIWACRSYPDDPVEYRISDGAGHGVICSRESFLAELRSLVFETVEVELHYRGLQDAR